MVERMNTSGCKALPSGTSDEHLSIVQYLKQAGIDGALVITTPQEARGATITIARSIFVFVRFA